MLARRLAALLPAMTLAEAIETTRIHRAAGLNGGRTAVLFGTRLQLTPTPRPLNRVNGKRPLDKAERSVRHLQRFLSGMRAVDITTDKVRTYIGDRQDEGLSNAEINREMAALKRMFNLALQQTPPKVP